MKLKQFLEELKNKLGSLNVEEIDPKLLDYEVIMEGVTACGWQNVSYDDYIGKIVVEENKISFYDEFITEYGK